MTETPPGGGPTVLRMILARQLQALREKAGMSYEQAAEAIYSSPGRSAGWSEPKAASSR